MSDKYENMSVFEQLKAGLEDSIAFSRGELSLKTTELPAPPPETRPAAIRSGQRATNGSRCPPS